MGIFSYLSLIPAMQGNIGQAFAFMGVDYLLDSQERKDRENPPVRQIDEQDYFPILRWALGTEWVSWLVGKMRGNEIPPIEIKYAIINRWNALNGSWAYLYEYDPFKYSFIKIAQKWVNAGCPD